MPKFRNGDPQVTFPKKGGGKYTKTYHSRSAAARAMLGMRKAGVRPIKTGSFTPSHKRISGARYKAFY